MPDDAPVPARPQPGMLALADGGRGRGEEQTMREDEALEELAEHRRTAEQLRVITAQLSHVLEGSRDGYFDWDVGSGQVQLLGITQIREPRLCLLGLGHRWFA